MGEAAPTVLLEGIDGVKSIRGRGPSAFAEAMADRSTAAAPLSSSVRTR
jgi:hypothetical protein